MTIQAQVTLRTRKLGVLMRDARVSLRRTIPECAQAIGVTTGVYRSYEDGRAAPSLPELEILAYYFGLPMQRFWSEEAVSDDAHPAEALNLPALLAVRQRMVGALLHLERERASISVNALAEKSGISTSRLKAFELGEKSIPTPVLEGLLAVMGGQIENLLDRTGPIGAWMSEQKAIHEFLQLSDELKEFVCKPVNRPYLDLAKKLSGLSTEKLRSVAEGLLDITF